MHKLIFIVLLVISIKTSGQANIICPGLKDSSLNYFYIGIDNPIEITGIKMPATHKISISGGGGMLSRQSERRFLVRVNTETDSCRIRIANRKGKIVAEKYFKIRSIPNPIATLAGEKDTVISRTKLLLNPFLVSALPGCYLDYPYTILSFSAIFISGTDSTKTATSGNILSEEQKRLVKHLSSEDKIYFSDIRAVCPDCRTQKLPSFWIKIE